MFFIVLLIGFIAMFCVTSPLIVILHELGHAFAILLFTKTERIDVFIGSYGDEQRSIRLRTGKLQFYIKKSFPFIKMIGMCRSNTHETHPLKRISILLAGSAFTVLSAVFFMYAALHFELHGSIKLYFFGLVICSFISLCHNLWHSDVNAEIENDGKQILFFWTIRKVYTQYQALLDCLVKQENNKAIDVLNEIFKQVKPHEKLLRLRVNLSFATKSYQDIIKYTSQLQKIAILNSSEYVMWGYAYSMIKEHEAAIRNYKNAIKLDNKNQYALSNLGYEYILTGNYDDAKTILYQCIQTSPQLSNSYSNLGYLYTLLKDYPQAKTFLDKSLALEPDEPYQYLHLGVYYLALNEPDLAVAALYKCKALEGSINIEPHITVAIDKQRQNN